MSTRLAEFIDGSDDNLATIRYRSVDSLFCIAEPELYDKCILQPTSDVISLIGDLTVEDMIAKVEPEVIAAENGGPHQGEDIFNTLQFVRDRLSLHAASHNRV